MLQNLHNFGVGVVPFGYQLEFPFPATSDEVATMSVETCVEIKFALHAVDALT